MVGALPAWRRLAAHGLPLACTPWPAVKRETANLVRGLLPATPKPEVLKLRGNVLPAVATLAMAGDSDVREAGQAAMVAFAVRVGNKSILDKVRRPLLLPPLVLLC
jgi:hypothetical protein